MNTTKITLLSLSLLISSAVLADFDEGKELHDETCLNCHLIKHDKDFYTRDTSRIQDQLGLRRQVGLCANNFSAGWFPEEEASVVEFLNTAYYQFKP